MFYISVYIINGNCYLLSNNNTMPIELNRQSALEKKAKEKPLDVKETQEVETKFTAVLEELKNGENPDSPLVHIVNDIIDEPDQTFSEDRNTCRAPYH